MYLGVDPGTSGAIALVDGLGRSRGWIRGDATDADLLAFLRAHWHGGGFAMLEEVGAKPRITEGGGRVSMGAKSAFTFGGSYRAMAMALLACGIPFERVLPRTWQTAMRCLTKGDKKVSKQRAQELFPNVKVALWNADALLLAEYARRMRTDRLSLDNAGLLAPGGG